MAQQFLRVLEEIRESAAPRFRQKLHTEGKVLDATASTSKPGDILTIQGEKVACNMFKGAMNKASTDRGVAISYKDATGNVWKANE